ncbi:MAG: hypothetical protein IT385_11440 [Deltaproteobacteria bacterium]|nr:hypothetical protein [Deltaproteobacteria bacterium]
MSPRPNLVGTLHDGPLDGRTIRVTVVVDEPLALWIVTHHGHGHRDDVRTLIVHGARELEALLTAHGARVAWQQTSPARRATRVGRAA